ncbi:hypothetical protein PsYK624_119270 [Phanerochaete sordida]|uniref:Uncharacterized protein n=1 Tax=Phanerochaete sordida TaxID=48140 RepID=A0A9P3LHP2_9APHY|nr:hypothetical protein PsYK624_119270 [Phanerochaete sordida]
MVRRAADYSSCMCRYVAGKTTATARSWPANSSIACCANCGTLKTPDDTRRTWDIGASGLGTSRRAVYQ